MPRRDSPSNVRRGYDHFTTPPQPQLQIKANRKFEKFQLSATTESWRFLTKGVCCIGLIWAFKSFDSAVLLNQGVAVTVVYNLSAIAVNVGKLLI